MTRLSLSWLPAVLILVLTPIYFAFGLGKRVGRDDGYRDGLHAAPEFVAYQRERSARDEAEARQKQAAFPDESSTCDRIVLLFTDRRPLDADDLCYQVREMVIEDLQGVHDAEQDFRQEYQQDR